MIRYKTLDRGSVKAVSAIVLLVVVFIVVPLLISVHYNQSHTDLIATVEASPVVAVDHSARTIYVAPSSTIVLKYTATPHAGHLHRYINLKSVAVDNGSCVSTYYENNGDVAVIKLSKVSNECTLNATLSINASLSLVKEYIGLVYPAFVGGYNLVDELRIVEVAEAQATVEPAVLTVKPAVYTYKPRYVFYLWFLAGLATLAAIFTMISLASKM